MIKTKIYTYLGTNGTITSPVHLENIYSVVKYNLTPVDGYKLTKDGVEFYDYKVVSENELSEWYEVKV
jgi:hypothetical protein